MCFAYNRSLMHDDYAHTHLDFSNEEKYPENIWRTNKNTHFPKNKENGKQTRGVGYCLLIIRMKRASESPRNLFSFFLHIFLNEGNLFLVVQKSKLNV